jgi:hypothetical protein
MASEAMGLAAALGLNTGQAFELLMKYAAVLLRRGHSADIGLRNNCTWAALEHPTVQYST